MGTTLDTTLNVNQLRSKVLGLSRTNVLRLVALAAIVGLAAYLRFSNLSALGYANHYYTAAIQAMLQSWHNFFFVAAEPGASVSIDKPPVGLWIQAISAYFLGVNGLGVLLPQLVAGILSVVVVNHLVGRSFGPVAGLLAALVMATTPVSVAVDRNNTMDSTLILTLLLAAWAFIKAAESGRLRPLLIGAALVGIGFNIKMLEAFLPLPAFVALYLFGAKQGWRIKIKRLALAMALLAVVSLSWVTIVQLTPADQRPYVGSSGNNSEFNLIVGYNGVERLLGMGFGGAGGGRGVPFSPGFGPPGFGGGRAFGPGGGGGFNGGMSGTGQAGALRLFTTPLSKEMSWLLPFGLIGLCLVAFRERPQVPVGPKHQAVILWGGWLLTGVAFFSVAGFFHEYYLGMIVAPMAAAFALGAAELWQLARSHAWLSAIVLIVLAGATLVFQYVTATAFTQTIDWLPLTFILFTLGVVSLLAALNWDLRGSARLGFTCVLAACLVTPAVWANLTMRNPTQNQSLPSAYSGQTSSVSNGGGIQVNQSLLDFLQANTQGYQFLMAVPSSMQGADYVLASGRPVLYLGGFMGVDQVLTSQSLSQLVTTHKLRYVYWDARGGRSNNQSDITSWVRTNCSAVNGFEVETRNSGAPDGTGAGQNNTPSLGFGNMQVSLYDCLKLSDVDR